MPVISTKVGIATEVVEDGRNGLLIDVDDSESVERWMKLVIINRDMLASMKQNTRICLEQLPSLEEIIRLQALLNNIKLTKEEELKESETAFKFSIEYLKMVEHTFSEKYYTSIQTTFKHLLHFFGEDCLLVSIKPKDAESFKHHIMNLAPKGYPVYIRNLKAAFNKALNWEMISVNPFAKIDIKKNQIRKPDFINRSELYQILENVKNHKLKKLYISVIY